MILAVHAPLGVLVGTTKYDCTEAFHTIKRSNPNAKKSTADSLAGGAPFKGAQNWPTGKDSNTQLLQYRLGYADHCLYQSVTGDPLFAQMWRCSHG